MIGSTGETQKKKRLDTQLITQMVARMMTQKNMRNGRKSWKIGDGTRVPHGFDSRKRWRLTGGKISSPTTGLRTGAFWS